MADIVNLLAAASGAGGVPVNPNAWDISKAYYDVGSNAGSMATLTNPSITLSISGQETDARGIFIKPDGTKMYIAGDTGDDINEYTLSTPWLVSSATYVQNFSVSSQETRPQDVFFKSDGTKMYIVGVIGLAVFEYALSTPWDISTASYTTSFSISSQEASPTGVVFKLDGTKMYIIGNLGDEVNEYDLSTAWDVSSASYLQTFSVSAQETSPRAVAFLDDGTKMFVIGTTGDDINQYDLSTAWDISTASYVTSTSVGGYDGLFVKGDGSLVYVCGSSTVAQFTIGGFSVASQETVARDVQFKSDGTKMYVMGSLGDDVNEYDLSTAWDVTSASYVQNFSVASQDSFPMGLFFKPDGTKMFVVGQTNDNVYEYALSTPWDVSSASYTQSFSISAQEGSPEGLFFKPDGTKMYVVGSAGDDVNEYDLSSAWDISTASYVQNFSVASQDTEPNGITFKSDGTKMYIVGLTNNKVYEYDLSTPWDISSASFSQNSPTFVAGSEGIYFKPEGDAFFIISETSDKVYKYSISPD